MIHADPLKESTSFPTHTHGLTNVGMPEFIMDPLAFGGEGNAGRINAAYDFFRKTEKNSLGLMVSLRKPGTVRRLKIACRPRSRHTIKSVDQSPNLFFDLVQVRIMVE